MDTSQSFDGGKKTTFEDLSKDELIKKCKGLLAIAQKAKQARDALQEENNELKERVKSKTNDDATTEIIESLTQQKLLHVNTIEDLKKENGLLSHKLQKTLEDLCSYEAKYNTLDNENVSFKRQVKRLTDENEQLIVHLDSLEKQIEECKRLGLEQQEQLLALENSKEVLEVANQKLAIENVQEKELQSMLSISLEEVKKLKLENALLNEKMENLKINLVEKDKNIVIIGNELQMKSSLAENLRTELVELQNSNQSLEEFKIKNQELENSLQEAESNNQKDLAEIIEKLREKLKLYHGKMVKFAANIKLLKENKNEILSFFKTYTAQVEEWKGQLSVTSQRLVALITDLMEDNEKLKKENQNLKESNNNFIKQLEAHKTDDEKMNEIEAIKSENKRLNDEVAQLIISQENLRSQLESITVEKDAANGELMNLVEKHQKEIQVFDDQNKKDTREIQDRIDENEKICIEYRKIISKLEENNERYLRETEGLKLQNASLTEELNHYKATEKQLADKTSEEIMKLVQENAELVEANKNLLKKNLSTVHSQTDDNYSAEEQVVSLKRENAELLTEMNEMNQALKERGESISKLQAHCEEVKKKLQIYETQANKNVDSIVEKDEIIKNLQQELENVKGEFEGNRLDAGAGKDVEIAQLKAELENLKDKLNTNYETHYAESESMSTSTISRADEGNRLKELEGSWEERYGKLRNLALKLKGKIRDLTTELTKEQNEKNDYQEKHTAGIKTISNLQAQCDRLEDDLEASKKQIHNNLSQLDQVAADVSRFKNALAENDETISRMKREIEQHKQEKSNTEGWKKQISAKVQALRKELEANKILNKDYEAQIGKLSGDLDAQKQALKAESDCHQQTKTVLENSHSERIKNSVLSLEMQDYERSVKDLSQKLEKKQEEVDELRHNLDSQKSTVNAVREQNKLLEGQLEEGKEELSVANSEINAYRKQISEYEEVFLQKDGKIHVLTQQLESVRTENEELSTELSKIISEHQKSTIGLKTERDQLRSQNLGLQQSLRESKDVLKLREDELKAVQNDYDSYKVRAQSVLRQNQSRDVGLEEKLKEDVDDLAKKCEVLTSQLDECKTRVDVLSKEKEGAVEEKMEVFRKFQQADAELEDLKNSYEQLTNKYQQALTEHKESVRNYKVNAETLSQCYQQQLREQEVRHNREIIELQSKIEKAPSPTEMSLPLPPTMHREEGEGSESTESVNRTNAYPVPLERLLGADIDQEILTIKKQLLEEESKVTHLTALLADTEQDLAKHAQMNKLLKEEIRRQQRSVEREEHSENLEYLKNVIFKFVTLNNGDERSRLVPVLNTILKLSPEETQKLNMVARGEPGLKGWTNYLWSPSKS